MVPVARTQTSGHTHTREHIHTRTLKMCGTHVRARTLAASTKKWKQLACQSTFLFIVQSDSCVIAEIALNYLTSECSQGGWAEGSGRQPGSAKNSNSFTLYAQRMQEIDICNKFVDYCAGRAGNYFARTSKLQILKNIWISVANQIYESNWIFIAAAQINVV